MSFPVLADSTAQAIIRAPLDTIDLTNWVFGITDEEYRACSTSHIAAGSSRTSDGKRMSINVENVGGIVVQHYVENISERAHCRLLSVSDILAVPTKPSVNDVLWEFTVEQIDAETCRFTNHIKATAMDGWEAVLALHGLTLEQAQAKLQKAIDDHNVEETPLFSRDIEGKARAGRWSSTG